jgi:hypothetical protein
MRTIIVGFIAGFLSVLVFHQLGFYIATELGFGRSVIYNMRPVPPFGVPLILSAAFWGGLWGIVGAYIVPRLPAWLDGPYGWMAFAAVVVTLVNWFIVLPIKGGPNRQRVQVAGRRRGADRLCLLGLRNLDIHRVAATSARLALEQESSQC